MFSTMWTVSTHILWMKNAFQTKKVFLSYANNMSDWAWDQACGPTTFWGDLALHSYTVHHKHWVVSTVTIESVYRKSQTSLTELVRTHWIIQVFCMLPRSPERSCLSDVLHHVCIFIIHRMCRVSRKKGINEREKLLHKNVNKCNIS